MAPARAARPNDVRLPPGTARCPFCPGHEADTPPEVDADRPDGSAPDGPGWRVRVVPNRYPALGADEGVHEVVIATPRHVTRLGDLTPEEAGRAAGAWRRRILAAEADPRGLWPFLFLNQGPDAGASLQHTHAQLVALPFAPPRPARREEAFARAPSCPVCADLARAAGEGRLVAEGDGLAAWLPETPELSAGVRVAPVAHHPRLADGPEAAALGRAARDVAARIVDGLGRESLNLWLHHGRPGGDAYHWHLDVVPRLGHMAGMELGAGVVAAVQEPAALAARLRGAAGS